MRSLVLLGAGGLTREVLAMDCATGGFDSVVVLDDDPGLWGCPVDGPGAVSVLGGIEEVERLDDHEVVVCVGRGMARRVLVARLHALGVGADRYATLVHRTAVVPHGCTVGVGSILLAGVVLTADVAIGDHVVLMPHVTLTHDDTISDFATLCAGASLGGGVRVGTAAYVGMHACVREGGSVGAGSTLGMGAALLGDLPDGATWVGVPARPVATPAGGS